MSQVTIYLDKETEHKMKNIVKQSGISNSKWIANLIREKTENVWPEKIHQLAGAWKDIPTTEEIHEKIGRDIARESL
ncbi:CopG family transcriptional regulator [Thermodesulfobacteriota bacterium]